MGLLRDNETNNSIATLQQGEKSQLVKDDPVGYFISVAKDLNMEEKENKCS